MTDTYYKLRMHGNGSRIRLATPVRGATDDRLPPRPDLPDRRESQGARNADHGVTLIETLLVIALIAVLLALFLPTVSSISDRARMLKAQSDLRQHAQIVQVYAGDYRDALPFFAHPDATQTVLRGSWGATSFHYFSSHSFWPYALTDAYYQSMAPWHEVFTSPFQDIHDPYSGATGYFYSCSLIASPDYWNQESRLAGTSQLRPVRLGQVRYTSSKAVFSVDPWSSPFHNLSSLRRERLRSVIAAVDGHARTIAVADLGATIRSGDGTGSSRAGHGVGWMPAGMHTLNGAHGRDLP